MMRTSSTPASTRRAAVDEAGEAAADEGDGDLVVERLALGPRDVGVVEVVGEPPVELEVLVVAVGAQALVALAGVGGPATTASTMARTVAPLG